jgi:hypothetical protein
MLILIAASHPSKLCGIGTPYSQTPIKLITPSPSSRLSGTKLPYAPSMIYSAPIAVATNTFMLNRCAKYFTVAGGMRIGQKLL